MHTVSNTNRSKSSGEEFGETGNTQSAIENDKFKMLIIKANSVPLKLIFKHYNIRASEYNTHIICPFKKHKGGRENSASFKFYPETNTFHCYGCNAGAKCCNFVAEMENISLLDAAYKILDWFGSEAGSDNIEINIDYTERLKILMEFSNMMREYIQNNQNDPIAIQKMEMISSAFDKANFVHKLDNKALRSLVLKIKDIK